MRTFHIIEEYVGHMLSSDCWCEPSEIYQATDNFNATYLCVHHNDITPHHHLTMVDHRNKTNDWITIILNSVGKDSNVI